MSVPGCFPRYELPQYGSRRRLLSPSGMYDEYGEVVVEGDGGYYYSPQGPTAEAEVWFCFFCQFHNFSFLILCSYPRLLILLQKVYKISQQHLYSKAIVL